MKHPLVLDPAGRKPGGETPLICTPLIGRSKERLLGELGILRKFIELIKDAFAAQVDPVHVIYLLDRYKDLVSRIYRILKPWHVIVADLAYVQEAFLAGKHLNEDTETHHPCGCAHECLAGLDLADKIVDYFDR